MDTASRQEQVTHQITLDRIAQQNREAEEMRQRLAAQRAAQREGN